MCVCGACYSVEVSRHGQKNIVPIAKGTGTLADYIR